MEKTNLNLKYKPLKLRPRPNKLVPNKDSSIKEEKKEKLKFLKQTKIL
jgi:hypothetical protein